MAASNSLLLLAAGSSDRALATILFIGLAILTTGLVTLMWTRWGHARPLAKCAGLSLFAHLLLLMYAYGTRVLFDSPGRITSSGTMQVRLADENSDQDASPASEDSQQPWEWSVSEKPVGPDLLSPDKVNLPEEEVAQNPAENPQPSDSPAPMPPQLVQREPSPPALLPEPPAATPPVDKTPTENAGDLAEMGPMPSEAVAPEVAAVEPPAEPAPLAPQSNPLTSSAQNVFETSRVGQLPTTIRRSGDGKPVPALLQARMQADRLLIASRFGGTPQTEASVAAAIDWLVANQSADGRWDCDAHGGGRETRTLGHDRGGAGAQADTAITGLALLALMGRGETHLAGDHRESVQHGLEFLLASQTDDGCLAGNAELFAAMYAHAIATLAVCEAFALTGDERLQPGAAKAIEYTLRAQHVAGGWRYRPGDAGDMSQFGWHVMSLKSAELAGLPIPAETNLRMRRFLASCTSGRARGLAAYRAGDRPSRTMTAEAMVCRGFLGENVAQATASEGLQFILEERPSARSGNFYYWYYATLATFQQQGREWETWNRELQRELLSTQRLDGAMAGSWDPDQVWGGYGGRVYSTALGALMLEVYYRYLPTLGDDAAAADRITERPDVSPYGR